RRHKLNGMLCVDAITGEEYLKLKERSKTEDVSSYFTEFVNDCVRKKYLSCDQHNSIGLKSGEYEDKLRTEAPTASIIGTIEPRLCADKLSITTTAPVHNCGTKNFSINTSNALPSIESFIVINATTLLILMAPITVTFEPTLEDSLTLRYR
ncbi:MAG: hypothetical protein ACYTX0_45150, partial [Nostoc sp.]